jgi:hypothetical protein
VCGAGAWVAASSAPRTVHVLALHAPASSGSPLGGGSVPPVFRVVAVVQCPSHVQALVATSRDGFVVGGRCGRLWCIDAAALVAGCGKEGAGDVPVAVVALARADAVAEFAGLRLLAACLPRRPESSPAPRGVPCAAAVPSTVVVVASGLLAPAACLALPHRAATLLGSRGPTNARRARCVPVAGLGRGQLPASALLVLAREPLPSPPARGHSANGSGAVLEG